MRYMTGMVIISGAQLNTSQYVTVSQSIQNAVSFPLWVAIPQCLRDLCVIPLTLKNSINRIQKKLKDRGVVYKHAFYIGHSMGGAMIPGYVAEHAADTAAGVIMLGAFLTHTYKTGSTPEGRPQVEFPVPSLTIGGDLDGLCRLTRIAEALYSQVTFSADPENAKTYMGVTVIPGLNHMFFASGTPTAHVKDNDLRAEITEQQAHAAIASDVALFMHGIVFGGKQYKAALKKRVEESTAAVQPIIDALQVEAFPQFLPACDCEPKDPSTQEGASCPSTPSCTGGVPWVTSHAQNIMGGENESKVKGLEIVNIDSIHNIAGLKASWELPHIFGNPDPSATPGSGGLFGGDPPLCKRPNECRLNITTVSQPYYSSGTQYDVWTAQFQLNFKDTGFNPISAQELRVRMKSRQSIWQAAGLKSTSFSVDEGNERCKEINQAAVEWAYNQLPPVPKQRFDTYGQKMLVGEDLKTCGAPTCWLLDPLRFNTDNEANTVLIQSPWFATKNVNLVKPCGDGKLVPCSAGLHYCKLLSPARAVEWMYVDGLKNKYSTRDE